MENKIKINEDHVCKEMYNWLFHQGCTRDHFYYEDIEDAYIAGYKQRANEE